LNIQVLLKGCLMIATLVLVGYLIETTQLGDILSVEWVDNEVRGKGLAGELLFITVGTIATALGLPRQLISFLGGYAFGFLAGVLLAVLVSVFGCVVAFYYARLLGRGIVSRYFPGRIRRIDNFISENTLGMTLLIRLLPVGSNLVTNLAAGVTSVRGLPFFSGSAIGYVPQAAVFALIGSGIQLDPLLRIGLGVVLFVCSGVLGMYLYRKYRHGKSLGEDIDMQLEHHE